VNRLDWDEGSWLNEPPSAVRVDEGLRVECAPGSDFWRATYYGFDRDSGHALLHELPAGQACEVSFKVDFSELYDQAGLIVRASASRWVKAGVEMSDGYPQVGAVVTDVYSDWSCAPVPEWDGRVVTMRASRTRDALIVRARCDTQPWRLVRVAPLPLDMDVSAGAYCAAPERAGLRVTFTRWAVGSGDPTLHGDL
jgi:uncharacterized protein